MWKPTIGLSASHRAKTESVLSHKQAGEDVVSGFESEKLSEGHPELAADLQSFNSPRLEVAKDQNQAKGFLSRLSGPKEVDPSKHLRSKANVEFSLGSKFDMVSAASHLSNRKQSLGMNYPLSNVQFSSTTANHSQNKRMGSFREESPGGSSTKGSFLQRSLRLFSFERKKSEAANSKLTELVTPVKAPSELVVAAITKADSKIISRVKSSGNFMAPLLPNYYMKSLEYYFPLDNKEYFTQIYKQHFLLTYNSMRFIKRLSQEELDKFVEQRKVQLKKKVYYNNKKTLVLDLDETLVHCAEGADRGDETIKITFTNGKELEASIFLRPHVKETLQELSKHFEIIIFTASHKEYADKAIDILDPEKLYVSHRLFREHCYQTKQGVYVKDLRLLNRKLKDIIVVDNAFYSYGAQIDNGVPIIPFYNCKEDAELLLLTQFLMSLKDEDDVRPLINQFFKYDLLKEAQSIEELYQAMFKEGKDKKRGRSSSKKPASKDPKPRED